MHNYSRNPALVHVSLDAVPSGSEQDVSEISLILPS